MNRSSFFDITKPVASPAVLQWLSLPLYKRAGVEVALLRLDQTHEQVSGNKGFKLKYALRAVLEQGPRRVLSFGGAFSNHIHALAYAGHALGLETIGVIRGESAYAANPTLSDAAAWGMRLQFVDRASYRAKESRDFQQQLHHRYGDFALLSEGGGGVAAFAGCREILDLVPVTSGSGFNLIGCAAGTGTTLAGLIASRPPQCRILGFPVLKGADFLYRDIRGLLALAGTADPGGWRLQLDAHFGGYGRVTPQLAAFIHQFEQQTGVVLDPVYTGKMLLRFNQLVADGSILPGSRVLLIHSGGLQGLRGMAETMYDRRKAFSGRLPL